MTQKQDNGQQNEHFGITSTVSNVTTYENESNIVNLFTISASKDTKEEKETKPFIHRVQFQGPQGEIVRVWANVDDGAMREVMLTNIFKKVKHRLGTSQLLREANGTVICSEVRWKGRIKVAGVSTEVTFEVFDSGENGTSSSERPYLKLSRQSSITSRTQ